MKGITKRKTKKIVNISILVLVKEFYQYLFCAKRKTGTGLA